MSVKTIDVAYDYLKTMNHSVSFKELWKVVVDQLGYDEAQARKKISQFYTDLSLDARFTSLENNVWDLKSNHKLSEVLFDSSLLLDEGDDEDTGGEEGIALVFTNHCSHRIKSKSHLLIKSYKNFTLFIQ